jgi:NADH-quinone oxidoreductase subunit E
MQVNYDFHEDLTPAKVDEILADYAAGKLPADTDKVGE